MPLVGYGEYAGSCADGVIIGYAGGDDPTDEVAECLIQLGIGGVGRGSNIDTLRRLCPQVRDKDELLRRCWEFLKEKKSRLSNRKLRLEQAERAILEILTAHFGAIK